MSVDRFGVTPLHVAIRHGSASALRTILSHFSNSKSTTSSLSIEKMIETPDAEMNLPLHSAIKSGSLETVRICLDSGASITKTCVRDRHNAVHEASILGYVKCLQMMFEKQPEAIEDAIGARDLIGQTPLHHAAKLDHFKVAELLVKNGAPLNALDSDRRTPLLVAASKSSHQTIDILLRCKASCKLRDKDNRNLLHILIVNGSNLAQINLKSIPILKQILEEKDDHGCTAVHYASKSGQITSLQRLFCYGASFSVKDKELRNPVHLAALSGKLQTCKRLLNSENGFQLLNEKDTLGRTPLHVASQHGAYKVIALLFRKGALLTKDFQCNTPLHLAAANGKYTSAGLLLSVAPHLLDWANVDENTALHLAAMNGHASVVDLLMSMGARFTKNKNKATFFDLAISNRRMEATSIIIKHDRFEQAASLSSIFGTPLIGLVRHMPKAAILFLDKCVKYSDEDRRHENFRIRYNFRHLQIPPEKATKDLPIFSPVHAMVKYNREECLLHPLCYSFLKQRWDNFGVTTSNIKTGGMLVFLLILTWLTFETNSLSKVHFSDYSLNIADGAENGTNSTNFQVVGEDSQQYFSLVILNSPMNHVFFLLSNYSFRNWLRLGLATNSSWFLSSSIA